MVSRSEYRVHFLNNISAAIQAVIEKFQFMNPDSNLITALVDARTYVGFLIEDIEAFEKQFGEKVALMECHIAKKKAKKLLNEISDCLSILEEETMN